MSSNNPVLNKQLLSLLVCPVSKAALIYVPEAQELVSSASGLAYPIRDGLPVMLETAARQLSAEEKLTFSKQTRASHV